MMRSLGVSWVKLLLLRTDNAAFVFGASDSTVGLLERIREELLSLHRKVDINTSLLHLLADGRQGNADPPEGLLLPLETSDGVQQLESISPQKKEELVSKSVRSITNRSL